MIGRLLQWLESQPIDYARTVPLCRWCQNEATTITEGEYRCNTHADYRRNG